MKKQLIYLFSIGITLLLLGCNANTNTEEAEKQKVAAIEAQAQAEAAKEKAELELGKIKAPGTLVHVVYFNIKDDLSAEDQRAFLEEVKKLDAIEQIQFLQIGSFKNLGDQRALSQYEMVMQMSFADQNAYDVYQQHPVHLALKEVTGKYMGGPPATYDYVVSY